MTLRSCSPFVGLLAVLAAACSSSSLGEPGGTGGSVGATGGSTGGSTGGAGGTAGAGGRAVDAGAPDGAPDAAAGVPLMTSATGFVQDLLSGIVGSWYPFGDGIGPNPTATSIDQADSDCVRHGGFAPETCSTVDAPIAGQAFPPDPTTGAMCTHGVAAMVVPGPSDAPDYADLWGAGIGLDLNNPGGEAGVKGPWDGSRFTGIAFDFFGSAIPVNSIRVLFPFEGEHSGDAPYYEGDLRSYSPLANNTHVVIRWTDVGGPQYLSAQSLTAPPFDPTKLFSIQFQVFTNTTARTPYDFCVGNLTLLRN